MTVEPTDIVGPDEQDRYSTLRLISWWDQGQLAQSTVMVVGAGALGNEVLKSLALLGIGQVLIVDFDVIEISNLSRSVLFRSDDRGKKKAEIAAERVRELNPDVKVRAFHADVVRGFGLGWFRRVDVVLGCLDNREARWAVNRACRRFGVPWLDGALDGLDGSVKTFLPGAGACYECGLTDRDLAWMARRYSCTAVRGLADVPSRVPTTITSASIIAAVQVQEALKILHGRRLVAGSSFLYSGGAASARGVMLAERRGCPAHAAAGQVVELDGGCKELSLAGVLRRARARLPGAWISLDRELVVRWRCSECGAQEPVMRPYDYAGTGAPPCGECGGGRFAELAHLFGEDSPGLETSLADAGIPPGHIIKATNGDEVVYLELTKDLGGLMTHESKAKATTKVQP